MIISPEDAALRQLDSAIERYIEGDMVSAITLAGASEEVLGKLCTARSIKNALESATDLTAVRRLFPEEKDRKRFFNQPRNDLKHGGKDKREGIEIAEQDPFLMIARAIFNLQQLSLAPSELVEKFRQLYKAHPLPVDDDQ